MFLCQKNLNHEELEEHEENLYKKIFVCFVFFVFNNFVCSFAALGNNILKIKISDDMVKRNIGITENEISSIPTFHHSDFVPVWLWLVQVGNI